MLSSYQSLLAGSTTDSVRHSSGAESFALNEVSNRQLNNSKFFYTVHVHDIIIGLKDFLLVYAIQIKLTDVILAALIMYVWK